MSEPAKTSETKTYNFSCHCQRNVFSVTLPLPEPPLEHGEAFTKVSACNCSHCLKRRIILTFVPKDACKVIKGCDVNKGDLVEHKFGAKRANYQFCPTCGTLLIGLKFEDGGKWGVPVNLRAIRDPDFDVWKLPFDTTYDSIKYDPQYEPATSPEGAEAYLTERAKHYDYPTKTYTGSCHCKAVTFAVLLKPIEEEMLMDCACSICLGNGVLWAYPGRFDVFFSPSASPSTPYTPDPSLVTTYNFNRNQNDHVFCKKCGLHIYEAEGDNTNDPKTFKGFRDEMDDYHNFGINVVLLNGMEGYLGDGTGKGLNIRKEKGSKDAEPRYSLKM